MYILIYLFSSSSLVLLHDHQHDHNLSFCEDAHQGLSCDLHCTHDSHIINLKERCLICDHSLNYKPAILDSDIKSTVKLYTTNRCELFTSLFLSSSNNTLNKSPPFII